MAVNPQPEYLHGLPVTDEMFEHRPLFVPNFDNTTLNLFAMITIIMI
jgi:hypothetical protein